MQVPDKHRGHPSPPGLLGARHGTSSFSPPLCSHTPLPNGEITQQLGARTFFFSPFCLHTFNTPQPFTASCLWPMATATEKLFLPGHPVPFPRQDPPYPPCIRSSTDKQCLVMPRFVLNRYSQIQPQLPHPTFKLSRLFQHIQRNLL